MRRWHRSRYFIEDLFICVIFFSLCGVVGTLVCVSCGGIVK